MNCPHCGNPVSSRAHICDSCGLDITAYRKIYRLSNQYYNRGLECAKVRDLQGAIRFLKKSLEMNKANIDARNLLGLVYFEIGETVAALSEWVISKNFCPEENTADYLMGKIQDNPTKLDSMNQAIRKYNLALKDANLGNDDLAILQLKKVVGLNPNFIRALQLLALLYIKNNEFEKAKKYLRKAQSIDVANTTTLKYMREIGLMTAGEASDISLSDKVRGDEGKSKSILPVSSYKEDKPNAMLFVNLLIGVVIGILVVYYLIVPTIETNIKEEYNSQKVDYSSELSAKSATITQLEKKVTNLESKLSLAEDKVREFEAAQQKETEGKTDFNSFADVIFHYNTLKSSEDYTDDELVSLAVELAELTPESYENTNAGEIIKSMQGDIFPDAFKAVYKQGKSLYESGKFDEAETYLKTAVKLDPEADSAMYYLGKTYQALTRFEEAAHYYNLMLEVCPNSPLKQYIPTRLSEMGMSEN